MRSLDLAALAGSALLRQPRRSSLCLAGLAIGVAAVVVLTAVGAGARGFVEAQFEALGSQTLAVLPGRVETTGGMAGFGGVPNDLTLNDAAALRDGLPGVERVSPLVIGNEAVEAGGRSRRVIVMGTTAEFAPLRSIRVRAGRFLSDEAWERAAPEVVLGEKLAAELFPDGSALGGRVRVGGWRMRVVGVLGPQGTTFGIDMDEVAMVPVTTGMAMFDVNSLFRIPIELRKGSDMDLAAERVRRMLTERHGEEDVTVTTPEAIVETLGGILDALTLGLAAIAAVSLAVAGIGIMNVMLVAVSERMGEVGLLKAIGARRRQILALFLVEAATLSAAGGLLGLLMGWGVVRLLVFMVPAFPASPPTWAVAASFSLAITTGVVFGWWPARRAVLLDPVAALARGTR